MCTSQLANNIIFLLFQGQTWSPSAGIKRTCSSPTWSYIWQKIAVRFQGFRWIPPEQIQQANISSPIYQVTSRHGVWFVVYEREEGKRAIDFCACSHLSSKSNRKNLVLTFSRSLFETNKERTLTSLFFATKFFANWWTATSTVSQLAWITFPYEEVFVLILNYSLNTDRKI